MTESSLVEYANRNWAKTAGQDRLHWAREYRRHGHAATWNASRSLWLHMKTVRRDWPSQADRQLDLENHLRLKNLLDRVADELAASRAVQGS